MRLVVTSALAISVTACAASPSKPPPAVTPDAAVGPTVDAAEAPDAALGSCPLSGTVDPASLVYDDLSGGSETGIDIFWQTGGHQLVLELSAGRAPFVAGIAPGTYDLAAEASAVMGSTGLSFALGDNGAGGQYSSLFGATAGSLELVSITLPSASATGEAHVRLHGVVLSELGANAEAPWGFGSAVAGGCAALLHDADLELPAIKYGLGVR